MFPDKPSLTLYDPLGHLLGAGDGCFTYSFTDAVKLAGHACPTVAGAFLLAKMAAEALFPETIPVRGDMRVTLPGPVGQGVNGPISQIFTLLTGAAAQNGFHGLAGQYVRSGLMHFASLPSADPFHFERISTGQSVALFYSPEAFPPAPAMGQLLPLVLSRQASVVQQEQFQQLWRQRVLAILADEGRSTIRTA
ncbi:hypothetical protein [Candidatus Magnetaquicoccus inordinatus]|uniref:hypothetical protein n=1 Tax=Candidatus Magnetaquicoccus inordinatus TaxID=2496818 RepID=UPI00102C4F63|nr:hypothetical protein [Candidatus Magnetaquicoccus inordinatus]